MVSKNRIAVLLQEGEVAARAGQRARARRTFRTVLALDPANVPALLWLGWLSDDPRASLAYVSRALTHEPDNNRAHAALHWARRRATSPRPQEASSSSSSASPTSTGRWNRIAAAAVALLALLILILLVGVGLPRFLPVDEPASVALAPSASPVVVTTESLIRTPTEAPSIASTSVSTPTSTPTPTLTATPTVTVTSTPGLTVTSSPALPTAPPPPPIPTFAPESVQAGTRWIDVDLTHQILTAYEGRTPVRTTPVSTGLSRTPTPTGLFHIQIKLRYDDMSGPGYYLRNVPYVMYFYRGYGLHGTYWHSNFGHPMSHGCVNLPTSEAEWLFNWAEVGTLVNIRR